MRKNTLQYILVCFISVTAYGQNMFTTTGDADFIALDYANYIDVNDIQIEDKAIAIDFGSLLKASRFGFGIKYTEQSIDFMDYDHYHDFSAFNDVHTIELYLKYHQSINEQWDMDVTLAPNLSSTFEEAIGSEDFIFSYALNFTRVWDNEGLRSYLKLGAGYGALFGEPNFYPLVSYSSEITEKFRVEIGLPVTGLYYKINDQSRIDFTAQPKSIYANNSSGFGFSNDQLYEDSKLELKALKLAAGYHFQFDSNWAANFNVGYLTASEFSIQDSDTTIIDFEANNSIALSIGISFNINNK